MRTAGLAGRMDLYLMQTTDYCHQEMAQPSCLHGKTDRQAPPHPHHLPFLETNWEVTPASNVAKAGAVVTGHDVTGATCREGISEQGKRDPPGRAKDGEHTAEIN